MGTTVVAGHIFEGNLTFAHVGDSRLYVFSRWGKKNVTKDHSILQRLIDRGELSKKQAKNDKRGNQIYSCLGASETVEISVGEQPLKKTDVVLLTTDGIHDLLSDRSLLLALWNARSQKSYCNYIAKLVEKQGALKKKKAHDNYTIATYAKSYPKKRTVIVPLILIFSLVLGLLTLSLMQKTKTLANQVHECELEDLIDACQIKSDLECTWQSNLVQPMLDSLLSIISNCTQMSSTLVVEVNDSTSIEMHTVLDSIGSLPLIKIETTQISNEKEPTTTLLLKER